MNVLYLAHRLPYPPNKGDKLRSYHELACLSERHDVWCACFVDDPADLRHVFKLRERCHEVAAFRLYRALAAPHGLWSLSRGRTFTEGYFQHLGMVRTLRRWNAAVGFDAVLVFSSGMAPYARLVDAPIKVLDFCDLDSRKWVAYAQRGGGAKARLFSLEGRRLADREHQWLDEFDAAVVITEAEAESLRRLPLRHKVHVIGNGVDLPAAAQPRPVADRPVVGFVGAMDYFPNVDAVCWFAEAVWPRVRQEVPAARFEIVGRHPTRAVRALADQSGVQVVGEVEDVLSFLLQFRVSVAPLRIACGLQNKVLEAMAAATPVVLTVAAATGMNATPGIEYLVADEPEQFAAHVVSLLTDQKRCEQIGRAARRHVAAHHCWEREMAKLERLLTEQTVRPWLPR
jgi:sugar transferase (PEP-CTERM/EpsH1 system associated)